MGGTVAPSHRGRGIARALLDEVANWARSEGATRLSLGVHEDNSAAREAYLRMGFRPTVETMEERGHPGQVIEVMEMDLGVV